MTESTFTLTKIRFVKKYILFILKVLIKKKKN